MCDSECVSRFDGLPKYLKENKLGCHWSLLAYLSFMLDADYYFPLRSRTFDELMRFYEVPVQLEGNVTWENYQKLRVMLEDLKVRLADRIGELPTTLEVQSYMWTLGRMLLDERKGTTKVSFRPIEKELDEAALREKRRKGAAYREMIGLDGELKVLAFEKNRLKQAGRGDLAKQVAFVAEDAGLGYDIASFDEAGNPKYIEVESTSQTRASDQAFFLSENERRVATQLEG